MRPPDSRMIVSKRLMFVGLSKVRFAATQSRALHQQKDVEDLSAVLPGLPLASLPVRDSQSAPLSLRRLRRLMCRFLPGGNAYSVQALTWEPESSVWTLFLHQFKVKCRGRLCRQHQALCIGSKIFTCQTLLQGPEATV